MATAHNLEIRLIVPAHNFMVDSLALNVRNNFLKILLSNNLRLISYRL